MTAVDLDVLIVTRKKRLDNLLCQVHTILNSGMNTRVTIGIEGEYPEFVSKLFPAQLERIRIVSGVPQGDPSIPIQYCMENLEWSDWMYSSADDDCILPWGLKHLWENRDGVSMVIGQTIGVSRERHLDFSAWKIGRSIEVCHVSTALINMRSLEKLEKPWLTVDPVSDFHLIDRMAKLYPYKITPSVVSVQAFAELNNLGDVFCENYMKIYGHLL